MLKKSLLILFFCSGCLCIKKSYANILGAKTNCNYAVADRDTVAPNEVMEVIKIVLSATDNFKVDAVANFYTPNAVVSDDEAPYSWNGPTAGAQWVDAVERACKENHLTKLKASIGTANVCQLNAGNIYIIIPVTYTGNLPEKTPFYAKGAFTFVLREVNGKWLIKSQAWTPQRAMD